MPVSGAVFDPIKKLLHAATPSGFMTSMTSSSVPAGTLTEIGTLNMTPD